MFIGEKGQHWRKNTDIIISTVMKLLTCLISVTKCSGYTGTLGCFVTCNKILNNKYNKTLLIQDRFVFVTFILQKCISKGYGEKCRPCYMPYYTRNYSTKRQCSNIHDLHIKIALDWSQRYVNYIKQSSIVRLKNICRR